VEETIDVLKAVEQKHASFGRCLETCNLSWIINIFQQDLSAFR